MCMARIEVTPVYWEIKKERKTLKRGNLEAYGTVWKSILPLKLIL